jgi:hypothetical protein
MPFEKRRRPLSGRLSFVPSCKSYEAEVVVVSVAADFFKGGRPIRLPVFLAAGFLDAGIVAFFAALFALAQRAF